MSISSHTLIRTAGLERQVESHATLLKEQIIPVVNGLVQAAKANDEVAKVLASHCDQLAGRVDTLQIQLATLQTWRDRGLWGRLMWLVRGA